LSAAYGSVIFTRLKRLIAAQQANSFLYPSAGPVAD
jgi:hypothetical protein